MSERSKGACDVPKSMPSNKAYDDGYDRIFKPKRFGDAVIKKEGCSYTDVPEKDVVDKSVRKT